MRIQSLGQEDPLEEEMATHSSILASEILWTEEPDQIPYDFTMEVRNRFKGLDLVDRVPDELWIEVRDIVQDTEIKTIPKEKKMQKSKVAV